MILNKTHRKRLEDLNKAANNDFERLLAAVNLGLGAFDEDFPWDRSEIARRVIELADISMPTASKKRNRSRKGRSGSKPHAWYFTNEGRLTPGRPLAT